MSNEAKILIASINTLTTTQLVVLPVLLLLTKFYYLHRKDELWSTNERIKLGVSVEFELVSRQNAYLNRIGRLGRRLTQLLWAALTLRLATLILPSNPFISFAAFAAICSLFALVYVLTHAIIKFR